MPHSGITREVLLRTYLKHLDKKKCEPTIHGLARTLKIKPPSLYKHIKSYNELQFMVAAEINRELLNVFKSAAHGKKGREATRALTLAYKEYAIKWPGRYLVSTTFPPQTSKEWVDSYLVLRDFFGDVIRNSYSLPEKDVRIFARALRSMLHGFLVLQFSGRWSQIVDFDSSVERSLEYLFLGLDAVAQKKR